MWTHIHANTVDASDTIEDAYFNPTWLLNTLFFLLLYTYSQLSQKYATDWTNVSDNGEEASSLTSDEPATVCQHQTKRRKQSDVDGIISKQEAKDKALLLKKKKKFTSNSYDNEGPSSSSLGGPSPRVAMRIYSALAGPIVHPPWYDMDDDAGMNRMDNYSLLADTVSEKGYHIIFFLQWPLPIKQ